jgi:hypothetical protein
MTMKESADTRLSLDSPAIYCIRIQGRLDSSWASELGSMQIQYTHSGGRTITSLTGKVVDQAALSGILNLVYDLGCPLISVDYLGKE